MKSFRRKKFFVLAAILFLVSLSFLILPQYLKNDGGEKNYYLSSEPEKKFEEEATAVESREPVKPVVESESKLPKQTLINIPFTSQAPFADWDPLHEEACEEASLIMVHNYIKNQKIASKEQVDTQIKDLVNFETNNGYGVSVTTKELSEIAAKYYGLKRGRVERNATIDGIKTEVAAGRPVIVPAAGKILPNPNFRNGGPVYHMLVIKGYDEKGFITNDPGTRKGEGYRYTFDSLYNAIHDWNPDDIMSGEKNYLVFD